MALRSDVSTVVKLIIFILNLSQISGQNVSAPMQVNLTPISGKNSSAPICPDEVNPFNLEFEVPEESPKGLVSVSTDGVPVLYWIPRKDLGCDVNHHKDFFQGMQYKIQPERHHPLLSSSPSCEKYINKWLYRISKVIEQNLILSLRVQSIKLVNDNFILRKFAFKNKLISQLTPSELLEYTEKLLKDLNDGFSLPKNVGKLDKDKFGELAENIRILKQIRGGNLDSDYESRPVHYECSWCSTCGTTILTDCVEDMYEFIIGRKPRRGTQGKTQGYAGGLEIFDEAVRAVRRTFGVKDDFSGLKLPMVPPCFV